MVGQYGVRDNFLQLDLVGKEIIPDTIIHSLTPLFPGKEIIP